MQRKRDLSGKYSNVRFDDVVDKILTRLAGFEIERFAIRGVVGNDTNPNEGMWKNPEICVTKTVPFLFLTASPLKNLSVSVAKG
jgi:hypothetical protein